MEPKTATSGVKYRGSPDNTVSISTVPGLTQYLFKENSTDSPIYHGCFYISNFKPDQWLGKSSKRMQIGFSNCYMLIFAFKISLRISPMRNNYAINM